jgi:nucleotide-binding universal stress UspA family protein
MDNEEIVVGVDGSEHSIAALRWAGAYASRTGATIRAVHAWELPAVGDVSGMMPIPEQRVFVEGARAVLDAAITEAHLPDDVPVVREVVEGAAQALLEIAKDASLLVVGRRGHSGVIGLLTGSVATYCANHSSVPVVVVP